MYPVYLPSRCGDNGLLHLIPLLNQANEEDSIAVDFADVNFYKPSAIVALLARLTYWNNNGKYVLIENADNCPASDYLKRIDFFNHLGIPLDENFQRHPAAGRFVTINKISRETDVDPVTKEIAECITHGNDPDGALQKCLSFAIGEVLTNVAQHSGGHGFIFAQRYQNSSSINVAIADNGIGLKNSYVDTELESTLVTPLLALQKSMEPGVSSALLRPLVGPYAQYVNKGIGLSMVDELVTQTYGNMEILTENAVYKRTGAASAGFEENHAVYNQGVLVNLRLNSDQIDDFENLISSVRSVVTPEAANEGVDKWDMMFDINADTNET